MATSSLEASLARLYEVQSNYGVMWAKGETTSRADYGPIVKEDMAMFFSELGGFLTPQQIDLYKALGMNHWFPGSAGGR